MASLYNTSPVMSPTDSMSSLSNLEKFMESASACTTPYNRSPTASPTHFPQQQAATSCSNWQAALQQQPDCMSMMSGSESAMYCNKQQQGGGGGGSMQGYLGSAPELLGSTMMSNDWQQLLDTNTRFGGMRVLPPVSMQVQASTAGIMEGARIRELIARSGSLSSSQWGSMDAAGITVDPSKGGFALQGGTVGVGSMNAASSHCLAQFTSDPAFAERAAKYSSFGAGKYSQIALPVTVENSSKPRGGARSVEIGSNGKISRTSSLNLKKQQQGLAAVATSLEDKVGLEVVDVATGEVEEERDDEDEEALGDDKSLPIAAAAAAAAIRVVHQQQQQQQELEAVEGATEAMSMGDHHQMMMSHAEVEVAAAVAQDNSSCSEQQQQVGGRPGGSSGSPGGGASPASLSPARSDDSGGAKKRKNSPPATAGDIKAGISYRDSKGDADIVDDSKPKRCKGGEEGGRVDRDQSVKLQKGERSCSDNSAESGSPRDHHKENHHHKLRDHSKQDYIHVRARRGQATDSHSLAERVRREKISERMKYLQDLVPGCSKVTGKAVMLDEIINYVQSLQRQVEHLSMKLASVNPGRPEFNLENLMSNKEVSQSARVSSILDGPDMNSTLGSLFQHQHQAGIMLGAGPCGIDFRSMGTGMDTHLRRSFSTPISSVLSGMTAVDAFDDNVSQSVGWDGELQSIVNHMGLSHPGRFGSSLRGSLHCPLPVGHMKAEF